MLEMMKRFLFPLLALAVISCKNTEEVQIKTIPYVSALVAQGVDMPSFDSDGAIFIVGDGRKCNDYADVFMNVDSRENVDASFVSDGLPDFCGEQLCVLTDVPFISILSSEHTKLSEEVVKDVMLSLDSLSHLSPFDTEGNIRKPVAKVVLLSNALSVIYGLSDVNALFELTGCDIPVISPLSIMMDQALDISDASAITTGIFTEGGLSSMGVYSLYFRKKAMDKGLAESDCVSFESLGSLTPLRDFMDNYIAGGYTKPIDAFIVDDFSIDVELLRKEYDSLTSVHNEESLKYKKYFSDSLRFFDCRETAVRAVFDVLRERNGFTHNIIFPYRTDFHTAVSSAENGRKIIIETLK